ncbi:MAG: hypothetical protein DMF74_23665 [Acidobacteria bacterium]|nr:MAG: hypothetical protein DMF74_23665 [Acidobacteriota bacterium]
MSLLKELRAQTRPKYYKYFVPTGLPEDLSVSRNLRLIRAFHCAFEVANMLICELSFVTAK